MQGLRQIEALHRHKEEARRRSRLAQEEAQREAAHPDRADIEAAVHEDLRSFTALARARDGASKGA